MKIIVLSDTHGNFPAAFRILDQNDDTDVVIHLGDEADDAGHLGLVSHAAVIRIAGNCDHTADFPRELSLVLEGKKFFLTHGDRYGVKATIENLRRKAAAEQADVVLYGHTHLASIDELDGRLYVNPGCLKSGCASPSYAVLHLNGPQLTAELLPLPEIPTP